MSNNYIDQIKAVLEEGSFTQTELARRLGVTFAALNRWVRNHAKPRPRHIRAIAALHREMVAFPAVDGKAIQASVRCADALRRKGIWQAIAKHPNLQEDLLLEHTYNSTSIEGTTLSKRETEAVIFHHKIIKDKSYIEHLEVTNHAAVLRAIFQREIQGPITENLIKDFHVRILQGVRPDAGNYSKHHRGIRGVDIVLTHPADIREEMHELIKSWDGGPPRKTLRDIAAFHVRFELIHPFGDGNGRVGRLLMALQCLSHDFPPVVIENVRKTDYYDVLEYAQKKSDGPFVAFLAEEMEKTARLVRKYL